MERTNYTNQLKALSALFIYSFICNDWWLISSCPQTASKFLSLAQSICDTFCLPKAKHLVFFAGESQTCSDSHM